MRRLGWWASVAGAFLLAAVATWLALDLLLDEANQAGPADRPAARIAAIRTGLTVAAGAGALIVLGLGLRRQWHSERVHTATMYDATERRITELYVQAVEQLGSERAPVRLGGLYALARLGQDNPGHRQTVLEVICAYLRMPFADGSEDELQVRLTAQRLLAKHLRVDRPTFWPDVDLDLSGATLVEFNLHRCAIRRANFERARFTGTIADFNETTFHGSAGFTDAIFEVGPSFRYARFLAHTSFTRATFRESMERHDGGYFQGTMFHHSAMFDQVAFHDDARFVQTRFEDEARFAKATFDAKTIFFDVVFAGKASFAGATFAHRPGMHNAKVLSTGWVYPPPAGWTVEVLPETGEGRFVMSPAVDGDRVEGAGE